MTAPALTAERLRTLMSYAPETGLFTRLSHTNPSCPRGVLGGVWGGTIDAYGYVVLKVGGRAYKAHRLAWLYMTGEWPRAQVDHRDGDRTNNRWSNLRDVSQQVNSQNQRAAHSDNATRLLGVTRNGKCGFQAALYINAKRKHLGTFSTPEAAHDAYLVAKRKLHTGNTI